MQQYTECTFQKNIPWNLYNSQCFPEGKSTWRRARFEFCCWFLPDHSTASIIASQMVRTTSTSGKFASLRRCFTISVTSAKSTFSAIWSVNVVRSSFSFRSKTFFLLYSTRTPRPSLLHFQEQGQTDLQHPDCKAPNSSLHTCTIYLPCLQSKLWPHRDFSHTKSVFLLRCRTNHNVEHG